MLSITICLATPGQLNKKKAEIASVTDIRREAAELSSLAENRFRLVWQGNVLGDDFDVAKLSKGLVMVVPMPEPKPQPGPKPEPVKVSEDEAQRFRLAFGSAIRSPGFYKVVKRMLLPENMESLAAACPGLADDKIAQAFLTRPELLGQMLDPDTLRRVGENHPALLEAAHNLAAAVHEEQASSGRGASSSSEPGGESEPGSYFLDEMSDEEMEEDDTDAAAAAPRAARALPITPNQLAAALAAATGSSGGATSSNPFMGVTGLGPNQQPPATPSGSRIPSTASTPGSMRITGDMFAAAMQQAMMGMGTPPAAAAPPTAAAAAAPQPDFSAQLATMRDMGIVDEGLAVRALQVMGGDLQAAVDLIFQGWLGEDDAMQ